MSSCSITLETSAIPRSSYGLSPSLCPLLKNENRYISVLLLAGLCFLAGCVTTIITKDILFALLCVIGGILFSAAVLMRERRSSISLLEAV